MWRVFEVSWWWCNEEHEYGAWEMHWSRKGSRWWWSFEQGNSSQRPLKGRSTSRARLARSSHVAGADQRGLEVRSGGRADHARSSGSCLIERLSRGPNNTCSVLLRDFLGLQGIGPRASNMLWDYIKGSKNIIRRVRRGKYIRKS